MMNHFNAFPLILMSLDSQIRYRGGKGFNCDVIAQPIEGSFSVKYEFDTPNGRTSLTTLNQFQLGILHTEEGDVHVMFCADKEEFFKVTTKPAIRLIGQKLLFITPIAKTFDETIKVLKRWYPRHTNWNLKNPETI